MKEPPFTCIILVCCNSSSFLSAAINFRILGCLKLSKNGAQSGNLQQRYLFLGDLRQPFF